MFVYSIILSFLFNAFFVNFFEQDFSRGIKFGWYCQIILYGISLLFFMGALLQLLKSKWLPVTVFSASIFSAPMFAVPLHWNHNVYVLSFFLIGLYFFLRIIKDHTSITNDLWLGLTCALGSALKLNSWIPTSAFLVVFLWLYCAHKNRTYLRAFAIVCCFLLVTELLIMRPNSEPLTSSLWIFNIKSLNKISFPGAH